MSKSLDEQILDTYQALKTRDKIEKRLHHLEESLQQLEERIQWLDNDLLNASKQLEQKHKKSDSPMSQLFHYLFQAGEKYDDQLEQDNHQYYLKVMELKDMQKQRDLLLFEKKVLEEKKENIKNVDQELKKMLHQKEYDISEWQPGDQFRDDLIDEQENIFFQRLLIKEMEEVMQEAYLCRNTLNEFIRDMALVTKAYHFTQKGQWKPSFQEKKAFEKRLKADFDFIGQHLRELNIQLKDISVSLKLDYQDEYRYFEDFTKIFYNILLTSYSARYSFEKLNEHLNNIRNDVVKIMDDMAKGIERSERSIKRSERKKELIIILGVKKSKKNN